MIKFLMLLLGEMLCVMMVAGNSAADSSFIPITYRGKAKAVIVLGSGASLEDSQAAKTLAVYLKKMSGATIRILKDRDRPVSKKTTIFVGPNKYLTRKKIQVNSDVEDAFIIRTLQRNKIVLLGNGLRGTTFSIIAFLEKLGCRWFMPGEIGKVIPSKRTLRTGKIKRLEVPDFTLRHFDGVGQLPRFEKADLEAFHKWMLRNRINRGYSVGFKEYNIFNGVSSHVYNRIIPKDKFLTMPELFPLVNGQRRLTRQRCVSNPHALEMAKEYVDRRFAKYPLDDIISLSPEDGGGWCQCEQCRAWDQPSEYIMGPLKPERSHSGRTFNFADHIAQDIQVRYPDKLALIYAYEKYSVPPIDFVPSGNLIIKLTHNRHACDAHPIISEQCELNRWWRQEVVDGWSDVTSNLWFHEYAYRWKACELPYPKWRSVGADLKYLNKAGVWGYFAHAGFSNWGSNGLYYYILSKVMWDVNADTNALMNDYCSKFYRTAAEPMKEYLNLMADAFEAPGVHIENISGVTLAFVEQMLSIYTPQVLSRGTELLVEAMQVADTKLAKDRVRLVGFTHRYTVLFLEFLQANLERKNDNTSDNIEKTINAGEQVLAMLEKDYIPGSLTLKQSIFGAEETVQRVLDRLFAAKKP